MATDFVEPKRDSNDRGANIAMFENDETGQVTELNVVNAEVEVTKGREDTDAKSNKCGACKRWCSALWEPCLVKNNPLPDEPTRCQLLKNTLMCPPHGKVGCGLTLFVATVCVWGVIWAITGSEALPGGNLFSLTILLVAAVIGGEMVAKLNLPPLLGKYRKACNERN